MEELADESNRNVGEEFKLQSFRTSPCFSRPTVALTNLCADGLRKCELSFFQNTNPVVNSVVFAFGAGKLIRSLEYERVE
jgi:hypothetical protein